MVNPGILIVAALLAAGAEWLHARRIKRVARLAFGPAARPMGWTRLAAPLRVLAIAVSAWGFGTLWNLSASHEDSNAGEVTRHLVVALDVSPSMHLADAGPQGRQARGDRARDVLRSILERTDMRHTRVSLIAFYTSARPVVIDSFDPEVVANVLADLPLEQVFSGGKTNLYSGVTVAGELAKAWREQSATLLVLSDGDTLPAQAIPKVPPAFGEVLVLGVGNARQGTFIDGHSSRQDVTTLERLALQLAGSYRDVNSKHLPSDLLRTLSMTAPPAEHDAVDWRWLAILAVVAGTSVLAILPPLLALWGGVYRPGKSRLFSTRREAVVRPPRPANPSTMIAATATSHERS